MYGFATDSVAPYAVAPYGVTPYCGAPSAAATGACRGMPCGRAGAGAAAAARPRERRKQKTAIPIPIPRPERTREMIRITSPGLRSEVHDPNHLALRALGPSFRQSLLTLNVHSCVPSSQV
jgi:hypothetical protein